MMCGEAQGLVIRRRLARGSRAQAEARRALRRHVEHCEFCLRNYVRYKR